MSPPVRAMAGKTVGNRWLKEGVFVWMCECMLSLCLSITLLGTRCGPAEEMVDFCKLLPKPVLSEEPNPVLGGERFSLLPDVMPVRYIVSPRAAPEVCHSTNTPSDTPAVPVPPIQAPNKAPQAVSCQ